MTNYKSTSTGGNDEDKKCEKCKRIIEAVFGPDKSIPEDSATAPTLPDSAVITFKNDTGTQFRERNLNENIIRATTPEEGDEKLVQKLEKFDETPLVDAEQKRADELKTNRASVLFSDTCSTNSQLRGDINILDELAKRCMNAPKDKIDSKLLEEMERIGIVHPCTQVPQNVPAMEDEIVQMGCPRKSRKPKKKKEIELEIRILERDTIKMPRRNFINRRAMRHLNMNPGNNDFLGVCSAQREPAVILETNEAPQKNPERFGRQQELSVENEINLLNSTQTVTDEQKQRENLNLKNKEVQEPVAVNAPASCKSETIDQNDMEEILKNLYEERIQQETSIVANRISDAAPAVMLSRELADVDDFRISPDMPKAELLTGKTMNSENASPDVTSDTTVCYRHAGQSELEIGLEEIRRVFDEEKVPLHPFVDLTNSGFERTTQKSKSQDLESGLDLLKPEYSSDGITTENMTDNIVSQTSPCTKIDMETTNTNISTDTTLTAETTNVEQNEEISNPMISSTMVQFTKAAANTASSQENEEPHIEAVGPNPQSQKNAEMNSFIDQATEVTNPQAEEMTNQTKSQEEMSLSELLKRIREKSRYEGYEQIMFTTQVPEVEPCAGKPPCTPLANPPPKTIPPRPCPSKPKKDKKDKKNPCAKFQKNQPLDTLGLVVIRAPKVEIPDNYSFPEKSLDVEQTPKTSTVVMVPDQSEVEDEKDTKLSNRILSQRVLNFIKEYEPWDSPFLLVTRDQRKK